MKGTVEVVKVLLEKGVDPNIKGGSYGYTALHLAARNNFPELVSVLLDAGADPNIQVLCRGGDAIQVLCRGGDAMTIRGMKKGK